MSALIHVKTLVIQHIPDVKIKDAVMGVINAIDSDLDEAGYIQSSDVDEAIAVLDQALVESAEEDEIVDDSVEDDLEDVDSDLPEDFGVPSDIDYGDREEDGKN